VLLRFAQVVGVIGRSKKQRIVCGRDFVVEKLNIDGKVIEYKQARTGESNRRSNMRSNRRSNRNRMFKDSGDDCSSVRAPPLAAPSQVYNARTLPGCR
jgi:hypothetical protein